MSHYSIREAKAKLSEVIRDAADEPAVISNHGKPAAFVLSPERYEGLLEEIEDLRDRLAVHESRGEPTMSFDKLVAELGLND
ncbi:RelB-like antitoxin [Gordonia phage Delian]|uniref:antitoxin from a toxin-antitoxin system n=1 Tax=Gordonia phage CaptainKirk2 TaxID=1887643 RepID=UPI00084F3D03|nr:antitoxin from a toxin-antitoxin system [Gordonia phage CaptainKirk2]AVP42260.1 RelB-like antitoxin [Gordonia phage Fenry]AXH67463.1 RelB-like antitoxin [Gordonia phage Zarbodnamra]QDH85356.1 RelB-like antitoxin [Gordonia phage MintFen]QGH77957.1 RelB-like antitoxin [Gordonia phage Delian]QNJ57933.1 RelB-like antitoxin [Gordonia phage Hitter]QNJ58443.1 RelB-like antitoxin [Gordonia phage Archis]QWY84305.1 RelB-like antitoxin [Gordonia phage Jalammah]